MGECIALLTYGPDIQTGYPHAKEFGFLPYTMYKIELHVDHRHKSDKSLRGKHRCKYL